MQKTAEQIADELLAKAGAGKQAGKRSRKRARRDNGSGIAMLPSPAQPMAVARLFVAERCLCDGMLTLHHWRGTWWEWKRSHWAEVEDREARSLLYTFTENALYLDAEGNP